MNAVHILVQPFGVQNSMPPVENKILHDKVKYYLAENYFPTLNETGTNLNPIKGNAMIQDKKTIKNQKIPGWQWKSASHSHKLEDRIRNNHNWQIYTKMIQQ